MSTLIATPFHYSLDGYLAAEDSKFLEFCFQLFEELPNDEEQLALLSSADVHIMGRSAYEGMSRHFMSEAALDHPFYDLLNSGRKVVFSRTMTEAAWANTTIASGDTSLEIQQLRNIGNGVIVAWGGVGLWRSLMQLDLIDEWHISLFPWIAGDGVRLFDDSVQDYQLEYVSSNASSNGIVELKYRRPRL